MENITAKVIGMENFTSKSKSRVNLVKNKSRAVKENKSSNRGKLEEATKMLDELGVNYEMKTKFHIKIDDINYYPGKGTIYICGDFEKLKEKGLRGLQEILREYEIIGR